MPGHTWERVQFYAKELEEGEPAWDGREPEFVAVISRYVRTVPWK